MLTEIVIALWDDKAVTHSTFSESMSCLSNASQPLILGLLWTSGRLQPRMKVREKRRLRQTAGIQWRRL